ncbi:hypothetical protein DES40_1736 [Litorimonas taeanensis]|uniref:Uncharacterized protein n=1 Tax=Litorimonas taeanensis TaxID=568099 RepID=A0A420WDG8_9PROT|nr:hypothetical protein [Litorimonas taeanensis]RKQ68960.1 hypothetical protein DES40_1736 [Litorimonas taeanensis]
MTSKEQEKIEKAVSFEKICRGTEVCLDAEGRYRGAVYKNAEGWVGRVKFPLALGQYIVCETKHVAREYVASHAARPALKGGA